VSDALFHLTPRAPEVSDKAQAKAARRAAFLGRMRQLYGPGPEDKKCKDCKHFFVRMFSKDYPKCRLAGVSGGPGTDWRHRNPTCGKFEARP
jgi:hypothetical protein